MTPEELRQKSWNLIKGARALVEAGQPDQGAHQAGYAVEFALKARYCEQNQIADLPSDPAKMRAMGLRTLQTHDLDKLLQLADGVGLKSADLNRIDWARALDWSVERRYEADGRVQVADAIAQIDETERLFLTLATYEILDHVLELAITWEHELGPINFLGLSRPHGARRYQLIISAWWLEDEQTDPRALRIRDDLRREIPIDLTSMFSEIRLLPPTDALIERFRAYPPARLAKRMATSNNMVFGVMMPMTYVITNQRWTEQAVRDYMLREGLPFDMPPGTDAR